jgi:hypothetical protein
MIVPSFKDLPPELVYVLDSLKTVPEILADPATPPNVIEFLQKEFPELRSV